jgi:hypothetical protein
MRCDVICLRNYSSSDCKINKSPKFSRIAQITHLPCRNVVPLRYKDVTPARLDADADGNIMREVGAESL